MNYKEMQIMEQTKADELLMKSHLAPKDIEYKNDGEEKKKAFSILLRPTQHAHLKAIAAAQGRSLNDVLGELADEFVNSNNPFLESYYQMINLSKDTLQP